MGKKEKEVAVKERPSNRTTKQSSKSKADTAAKKKRSVKNVPPADPQEATTGASGDAETGSHNSRKDSKEEAAKDGLTAKPTGNDQQEWNSETVRNAKLLTDGFTCCLILVMEDSPQLSKYGEFLLRAVESGVRRKFTCISGAQTAERVKRFLVSSGQREGQAQDESYMERQDIFAEAVKLTMLGIKDAVSTEIDADIFSREMELAGARSKDYVRYVPPITVAIQNNEAGGSGDPFGIREPPPPPPPTEVGTTQQPRKRSKTGKTEEIPDDQSTTKDGARNIGVKTRMRKRGEVPLPEFEVIDDTPTKGPRSYVLLQGFYNPRIIDELRKIGVIVDGILLMTDESVTKYNFSIIDVEDSIPGTFRPRNVLPQYLKAMERLPLDPETQNANVTKFWATLSEMYNSAPAESPFHDIALMNFKLPEENKQYLDSPDGLTFYVSKVFDEVAKRVYEMLVLEEWFHEFTSAADVTQLQPLEPSLPHDIYDQIVENIPAECMSVTILLEAVVQQVTYTLDLESGHTPPPPCYEEDILAGLQMGKSTFGKTNWGIAAKPGDPNSKKGKGEKTAEDGDGKVDTERTSTPLKSQLLFKTPMYIKSGDYASIRSCHLNESMAAKIASCQLSGDIRNIQGFLWNNVPDFNRGLYMKLLGNLNHFMYFLPPDMIQFEDMFYILHLLMSAGVEVHLQKEAESRKNKSLPDISKPSEMLISDELYYKNRDESENKFPGTNLDMDRNYLAVSRKTGLHFVISPNSSHELTIASFGHTQTEPVPGTERTSLPYTEMDMENFFKQTTALTQEINAPSATSETKKKIKKKKSKHKKAVAPQKPQLDPTKVARITANNAIESAVEYAQTQPEYTEKVDSEGLEKPENDDESPIQSPTDNIETKTTTSTETERKEGTAPVAEVKKTKSVWEKAPMKDLESMVGGDGKGKGDGSNGMQQNGKEKRFIACEEQWFDDIHDKSVIQALLECPALLAINESGAMDLSKWVEKYLFSYGMDIGGGEGILLGDLKNWKFIEELVPIQTVQMLNEASQDYLSMQRMYCPFYDTLLFIFNNPSPKELTAETQFYLRLKTLPGLQHFLEYTMNDTDVLKWIEAMDSTKRLEMGETCNINTLLNIIPEEQWLLVPSIKYQIMVENARHSVGKNLPPPPAKGAEAQSPPNKARKSPETTKIQRSSLPTEIETDETQEGALEVPEGAAQQGAPFAESAKTRRDIQNLSSSNNNSKGIKFEDNPRASKDGGGSLQSKRKSDPDKEATPGTGSSGEQGPKRPSENDEEKMAAMQAAANALAFPEDSRPSEMNLIRSSLNFTCFDLGKRVAVVGNDTFYIFPMDGTIIRYDISTIEPEFRMMQLSVTKNGHQSFFYPYYIPHDFDLSSEDYVVCPYFHIVLSNGTICAFQDLRAEEAAPYMKVAMKDGSSQDQELFSYEKILFGKEVEQKLNEVFGVPDKDVVGEVPASPGKKRTSGESAGRRSDRSNRSAGLRAAEVSAERLVGGDDVKKKQKQQKEKKGKEKKVPERSPDPDQKKKLEKKSKKKLQSKKAEDEPEDEKTPDAIEEETGGESTAKKDIFEGETVIGLGDSPSITAEADGLMAAPPAATEEEPGDWMYPSSDSEDEEEVQRKRRMFFAPPWDDAVRIIKPLAHIFKVTLPSGCCCSVEDLPGPPLLRVVKQAYLGAGSARSLIEASRYYTMDGSVIKFLFNGSIQILTARGVTTNVTELAANARRDTENISSTFGSASIVKIFNGEVILPNGQLWKVENGKKVSSSPIYVFTTGPLSGGEIFRRRQDGVVYLHRYDGTVITHYPDGTRFTTRMVVQENPDEFDDWVFVGLKYMVEHPNYCTVLFNTLSGNAHLKLPHGEWIRIFADGNIRITATDDYTLDVDKNRAILSYPPCEMGRQSVPNMTSVRLWHTGSVPKPQVKGQENATVPSPAKLIETLTETEGKLGATESLQQKRASSPLAGKKGSRRNFGDREKAKSHAKIKQRDPASRKLRGTRIASAQQMGDKGKSRSPSPGQVDSSSVSPGTGQDEANEGDGGGAQGETGTPKEVEGDTEQSNPQEAEGTTLRNGEDDDVGEFLKFENESTLCKSVDSWDNRFTMDLYGGIVVDKTKQEDKQEQTTQQLIESLSEYSALPKDYFAGILRNTSSEHLITAAKRFRTIKQTYMESCSGSLPKTKIFVVKRDLTGFQFMQKAVVDEIVTKAYGSHESMVIFDPLPKRQPRKFITVMRPVDEDEHPHGMWTRPYIEPMFRPKGVTNKHLKIANPNDLRWFGYVLSAAHARRPQFMPDAKNLFKIQKMTPSKSVDDVVEKPSNLPSEYGFEEEDAYEEYEGERSDSVHSGITSFRKPAPSIVEDDKKKKKKKDKDGKKHAKKDKERKGKRRESVSNAIEEEEQTEEEHAAPETTEGRTSKQLKKRSLKAPLAEVEIGEYPADIEDLKGIYNIASRGTSQNPRISLKPHETQCNMKKAVVVRAFVEIPQVDEDMQRALLAASMSYAETVKTETALFNSYKPQDPRSEGEKKAQTEYKQQLIEQNIDEMHLLEQKPGPVLRFHF